MSEPGSFIKSEILKDIRGRSRFIATPLDEHLQKIKEPTVPQLPDLFGVADQQYIGEFGVDAKEIQILLNESHAMAFTHPGVAAKLKDLLTLVKLSGGENLNKKLAVHRQSIENRKQEILRRDSHYQRKCNDAKAKRVYITKSWANVQSQVRTRWKSILKSLSVALTRQEFYNDLHPRDRYAIGFLNGYCAKHVVIRNNRVTKFDTEMLEHIDVLVIRELVENLLVAEEGELAPQSA